MKISKNIIVTLFATLLVFVQHAFAQESNNAIEAIDVSRQGDDIAIKIDMKDALLTAPASFSMATPAKIALDFALTANALGKNSQVLNQGNLHSYNVVQVGERTRVVLNLVRNMTYTTRLDGKALYLQLSPIESIGDDVSKKGTRFAEEKKLATGHAIHDVVFRRGKDGEARIVVDLSDSGTGIDIRQQGNKLIVDFLKTSLPEHLRRKLDVTDFATPVTAVESQVQGNNARMTISPSGLWEHSAYQSENQFVIEVKKIVEDPNKLVQGSKFGYQGPRVSINYQNGEVRALLRLMAEELGLNAVISETVQGKTTLVMNDVPADQVVDVIFQQQELDMRKNGNVVLIAPRAELALKEKEDFEARQQIGDLEPLKTEKFILNYQKSVDVAKILMGGGLQEAGASATGQQVSRILTKRGSVIADPNSNLLFVNDIPSKLEEIRKFIKAIDFAGKQVLIEARVVEANDNFNKDLGMKLNFLSSKKGSLGGGVQVGGGVYDATGQTNPKTGSVNLPGYASGGLRNASAGGAFTFSLFNASLSNILNLELAALEVDGGGKIISSPRIITGNNIKAKIEDGEEIPIITPGTANAPATVRFRPAKLSLEVTPQITPDGTVRMELTVKKETADWANMVLGNPPIKSSTVETNVIVENGGTLVIGGVYKTEKQDSTEKVPLFGDIPLVGWAFKYRNQTSTRRELLVFITPRIISENLKLE